MTVDARLDEIVEQQGKFIGPYRPPRNLGVNAGEGSIHDDQTAKGLGFRGGTVAGSIHMEQFPPILMRAFGERWFETGSLSCYFRNATVDSEPVRPIVEVPSGDVPDQQARVWAERDDGLQVLEGTASIGSPGEPSMLRERLANQPERGETRILSHLVVGTSMSPVPTKVTSEQAARRLEVITEPLDWYTGPSPWGGPVMHPGLIVRAMRPVEQALDIRRHKAVGLFGGLETRHLGGPAFLDHEYEVRGELLHVGETPKSEYLWYESILSGPGGGPDVASMIMMLRFMKGSSALWRDA